MPTVRHRKSVDPFTHFVGPIELKQQLDKVSQAEPDLQGNANNHLVRLGHICGLLIHELQAQGADERYIQALDRELGERIQWIRGKLELLKEAAQQVSATAKELREIGSKELQAISRPPERPIPDSEKD